MLQISVESSGIVRKSLPFDLWASQDSSDAEVANAISAMYEKLSNPGEFVPALKKICKEDHPNQMIIAQWAIALAIKGLLPREEVWKCLTDDGWRKATFMKVTDSALDRLFLAFSLGMDRNDNTWKVGLFHVYAIKSYRPLSPSSSACSPTLAG